jgi:hypothetical protein
MKNPVKILVGCFLFLLTAYVLSSCATVERAVEKHQEKKANRFFNEHPGKDAQRCADHFPLHDSLGQLVLDSVKKSDNLDHTGLIDSITSAVDSLPLESLPFTGKIDTGSFRLVVVDSDLRNKILRLKASYKPCKPDTLYYSATNFTVDGAAVAAATAKYEEEHKARVSAESKLVHLTSQNKVRLWMLISSGILILLLLTLLYLVIRGKSKTRLIP